MIAERVIHPRFASESRISGKWQGKGITRDNRQMKTGRACKIKEEDDRHDRKAASKRIIKENTKIK